MHINFIANCQRWHEWGGGGGAGLICIIIIVTIIIIIDCDRRCRSAPNWYLLNWLHFAIIHLPSHVSVYLCCVVRHRQLLSLTHLRLLIPVLLHLLPIPTSPPTVAAVTRVCDYLWKICNYSRHGDDCMCACVYKMTTKREPDISVWASNWLTN